MFQFGSLKHDLFNKWFNYVRCNSKSFKFTSSFCSDSIRWKIYIFYHTNKWRQVNISSNSTINLFHTSTMLWRDASYNNDNIELNKPTLSKDIIKLDVLKYLSALDKLQVLINMRWTNKLKTYSFEAWSFIKVDSIILSIEHIFRYKQRADNNEYHTVPETYYLFRLLLHYLVPNDAFVTPRLFLPAAKVKFIQWNTVYSSWPFYFKFKNVFMQNFH